VIEVHPLPGVMDPAAQTVRDAAAELTGVEDLEVVTGRRYDVSGVTAEEADRLATGLLSNAVVEQVHHAPWTPERLPEAAAADQRVRHVEIRDLDDAGSRSSAATGTCSSTSTRCARSATSTASEREPTDIELETLAQTWSEHCVHKTLKSTVTVHAARSPADVIDWTGRPGTRSTPTARW
jgi:phosphoribosylformylglycinamidine (FGAM) synthase PurS component